jgi:hypothetical protein
VAEWSNVPDSKSGVVATLPRVRIPPSPPEQPRWASMRGFFSSGYMFSEVRRKIQIFNRTSWQITDDR